MNYEILSNSVWTYPDSLVKSDGLREIRLVTAKNATASCQIFFNDLPLGASVKFDSGLPLPLKASLTISRGKAVYVAKNSGNGLDFFEEDWSKAQTYATRRAPFEVFDALEALSDLTKVEARTEMYVLALEVPLDAAAGEFAGKVLVKFDDIKLEIPLQLRIYDVSVPEKENLMISNWYWVKEMAEQYQTALWSDAHFFRIEQYARLMRRVRQTHFWVPKEAFLAVKSDDGAYEFDFSLVKRLIELMLPLGFRFIEGPLLAFRGNFGDDHFLIDAAGEVVPALSEAGQDYLKNFLTAWREFLLENHWLQQLQQHVADEPTDACEDDYQALVRLVRTYLPDTMLLEAVDTLNFSDAAPDILIPTNLTYQKNSAAFETLRAQGHKLWYYTCCYPNGRYLNRFLDMPLIRTRLLHWANIRYHLTGYLHWGLNAGEGINPFHQTEPYFPAGDMFVTYPGSTGPLSSMRLEIMRQGLQDFELLFQLQQRDPELAQTIVSKLLTDFEHFKERPDELEKQRQTVLDYLERH